jgi:hypothetical protein
MVINCLCRVSSGLPVTLLELNVLAHVVFAVLMYIFWWRKPHDVRHPISLSPAFLDESLCAMLYTWDPEVALTRSYSGLPEPREGFGWHHFTLEINGQQIRYACSAPVGGGLRDTALWIVPGLRTGHDEEDRVWYISEDKDSRILPELPFSWSNYMDENRHKIYDLTNGYTVMGCRTFDEPSHSLTRRDLQTVAIAVAEYRKPRYPYLKDHDRRQSCPPTGFRFKRPVSVHQAAFMDLEHNGYMLSFTACCIIYSGVHTSAWNNDFPSSVEKILWKSSYISLLSSLAIIWLRQLYFNLFELIYTSRYEKYVVLWRRLSMRMDGNRAWGYGQRLLQSLNTRLTRLMRSRERTVLSSTEQSFFKAFSRRARSCFGSSNIHLIWQGLYMAVCLCNILARAYIIIECFLSIRRLPEGSYSTVAWEDFWPHL